MLPVSGEARDTASAASRSVFFHLPAGPRPEHSGGEGTENSERRTLQGPRQRHPAVALAAGGPARVSEGGWAR